MARTWNGSAGFDEIINCSPGNLSGNDGGPITVAALWTPAQTQFGAIIRANNSGGSAVWALLMDTDGRYYIEGDFSGFPYVVGVPQLVAYTKASGSATYRGHLWRADTNGFSHTDVSTVGDGTGPVTEIVIGGGYGRLDGDMEWLGAWNAALTDDQIESLPTSLAAWLARSPGALWVFDQSAASVPVLDWTGGGANQTSITGTAPAVATRSVPGASYGHPVVALPAAAGGLAVTPAAVTVTATPGTLSMSVGVEPAATTVTATPGTLSLGIGVELAGPTVTATPGAVTITTTVDVTPDAATVTVTPGTLTVSVGGATQDITPGPVTVTAAAGTLSIAVGMVPDPVTVTATAGSVELGLDIPLTGAAVSAIPGTLAIGQGTPLFPDAVTVTATPGGLTVTTGAVGITPAAVTVSVTAGTLTVGGGIAVADSTATVTASVTSTPTTAAGGTSTATVAAAATSTSSVSEG